MNVLSVVSAVCCSVRGLYDGPIPRPAVPTIVGRRQQTERESVDPPLCKTLLSYSLKHNSARTHAHTQTTRMGQITSSQCMYYGQFIFKFNKI